MISFLWRQSATFSLSDLNIERLCIRAIFYRSLEKDPFHLKSTLVHLAAAMELGHSNELYNMSCNLVKDYPQK